MAAAKIACSLVSLMRQRNIEKSEKRADIILFLQYIWENSDQTARILLQSAQLYNRAEPGKPERGNLFRSDIYIY